MGYFVRAFCTVDKKPTVRQILEHINQAGYDMTVNSNLSEVELDVVSWDNFELFYKPDKLPILVNCNHIADKDALAKQEIDEFIADIGPASFLASKKKKVIQHLQTTKYVVANQLPTSDIDDDGYDANGELLKYFVSNFGGLIHADGEGFYDGVKVIVPTE